ncbi:MAG: hypothetical protein LBS96_06380 [Oscillospiraceae bacterium]|jgi:hypothetical protein|nr:hypothetical protein [Oscillospiraceae bacterium]
MSQLSYILSRIRKMDTAKMRKTAHELSGKAHKPAAYLFADMVLCGFRYGAGYLDYRLFEFYDRTAAQRASYLTRGKSNAMIAKYNNAERATLVENKRAFCDLFGDYLGRDWLDISTAGEAAVAVFRAKHPVFFAKTPEGMCGSGVRRINSADFSPATLQQQLAAEGFTLWEEAIRQHAEMAALCPKAVNTLRMVTLALEDGVHLLAVFLRMGNGKDVDNLNAGGFAAPVEIETGVVAHPATDKNGVLYEMHPFSGKAILGFQVPFWPECLALVQRAARVEPTVRYIGWDVALTPAGPVLVEANTFPGHDITQMPAHTPGKTGMLPLIQQVEAAAAAKKQEGGAAQ